MSLDYSAVPRMPDGRTAADHIATVEATASRKVRVPMGNGGKMMWHVWEENSGKPILLLFHGGSGSWIHWIRNVRPLAEHFTIYAADLPGLGDSDASDDVRERMYARTRRTTAATPRMATFLLRIDAPQ